jgi:CheY-like chemotaxis protein
MGEGSTFWFTARLQRTAAQAPAARLAPSTLGGVRVLVVDDRPAQADIVQAYVQGWGLHCDSVCGGPEALIRLLRAALGGNAYDIAIVDLQMPDMDGIGLARAVRGDTLLKNTQLVALTAFDDKGQNQAALAAGFVAYLTKPFKRARLFDTLCEVMAEMQDGTNDAQEGDLAAAAPMRAAAPALEQAHTILLVEDNVSNRAVALEQLARLGCKVEVATNGSDAVERLCRPGHRIDLVLMDCQMPQMDGYTAAAYIRAWETHHGGHVPIIALTAQALKGDAERSLAAGMDDHVTKPVRLPDLREAIRRWLPHEQE